MHAPIPRRTTTVAALLRTALLALLATLVVTGPLTVPAAAAGGDVTWTVRTAPNGYGSDRSSFAYGVNPGGRIDDAMVVANRGKQPLTLAVYAADGYTTDTGRLDLLTRDKKSVGVGAWVHADRANVQVAPGRTVRVPFSVTVPANATPGDYVGGLLTSLKQADDAAGINVDRRLGIRLKLRVSGALRPRLAVEDLAVDYHGTANPFATGGATVTYTVHNTGNAVLSARQNVSLNGPFGRLKARTGAVAAPPELLPGERWKVTVPVHEVTPAFRLTATVTLTPLLTDASGSVSPLAPVRATAGGWAVPWTLLIAVLVLAAAGTTWLLLARRARARRAERENARVQQAVQEALRAQETQTH
ncbi:WxL protein peptidoglycan domain-containing protein [Streptomyces sp. NPDC093223]|uniref:WxL protein peptidoglycan domain-containing protein n=1 Tax=Streptomyces sp. NPDC093223 TaxID=3366033 RepID=UPI0038015834